MNAENPLIFRLDKAAKYGHLLLCSLTILTALYLTDFDRPVAAKPEGILINMPLYGRLQYREIIAQAEQLANNEISRQFSQNPELVEIQAVVMGDRNGEIVPMLEATVSRDQWRENPQVSVWKVEYYNASYALLQRHDMESEVSVAAANPRSRNVRLVDQAAIDRALDEGRLTGAPAQDYLNQID